MNLTWKRHPVGTGKLRSGYANYSMLDGGVPTGIEVRWCGHPTATYRYWVRLNLDGDALPPGFEDAMGEGVGVATFRHVAEAKAAAERWLAETVALRRNADRIDGYDRDDLGESPDY